MSDKRPAIGILGGTFDPVHYGHIQIADLALHALKLQQIYFVPCKTPVLKDDAKANQADRLAMLKLALMAFKHYQIDTRELDRDTPSYMVETLESFQKDFPDLSLCLILGSDAFAQLTQWHEWEKIPLLCHIIVVNRPDAPLVTDEKLKALLETSQVAHPDALFAEQAGKILVIKIPDIPISSTRIRELIGQGKPPIDDLPLEVWEYIRQNGLYRDLIPS